MTRLCDSREGGLNSFDQHPGKTIERIAAASFDLWVQLQMADDLIGILVKPRKQQQPGFGFLGCHVLTSGMASVVSQNPGMIENRRQAAVNSVGKVVGQFLLKRHL